MGHEPRLGDRARRAAGRPVARHRRALDARTAAPPPTTTPTTCCCARSAASTARSRSSSSATRSSTTGAATRSWEYVGDGYGEARATAEGWPTTLHAHHRPARRLRGLARAGPHDAARRRHGLRRARVLARTPGPRPTPRATTGWSRPPTTGTSGSGTGRSPTTRGASTCSARALTLKGLTYAPDRRDDRGRDDVAARDPRRRAQLGLPLLLGPRLDLHALGPALARLRVGGQRLLLLHAGGRAVRRPAGDVRHPGRARADRGHARPPLGLRQRPPRADRQRRLQPAPARRVGHDAGLDLPAREVARPPARAPLAADRAARRGRDRELAQARPRHLGGARGRQALRLLQGHVLGRVRPRRAARPHPRRPRARRPLADARRRDQGRHHRARLQGRRLHPALRHRRAGRAARC